MFGVNRLRKGEYRLSERGILIKAVTRYSDTDYDITYYKLNGSALVEKTRWKNLSGGFCLKILPLPISMKLDTIDGKKKSLKKIVFLQQRIFDQYEYHDGDDGKLST